MTALQAGQTDPSEFNQRKPRNINPFPRNVLFHFSPTIAHHRQLTDCKAAFPNHIRKHFDNEPQKERLLFDFTEPPTRSLSPE